MIPEVGLLDLAAGALIVVGIFAAFMIWCIFPILPFVLMGALYALVRRGLPAFERVTFAAGRATAGAVRRALTPVALWVLEPAAAALQKEVGR